VQDAKTIVFHITLLMFT